MSPPPGKLVFEDPESPSVCLPPFSLVDDRVFCPPPRSSSIGDSLSAHPEEQDRPSSLSSESTLEQSLLQLPQHSRESQSPLQHEEETLPPESMRLGGREGPFSGQFTTGGPFSVPQESRVAGKQGHVEKKRPYPTPRLRKSSPFIVPRKTSPVQFKGPTSSPLAFLSRIRCRIS